MVVDLLTSGMKTLFDLQGGAKKKVTYRTPKVKILIKELLDPAHLVDANTAIQMTAAILQQTALWIDTLFQAPSRSDP
jgi:hypothetical protein